MKTRLRSVSVLALMASAVAVSPAEARPRDDVGAPDPIDIGRPGIGTSPSGPRVTRQLDVQRELVLPSKYRALTLAEQQAQLQDAIPEAQANKNLPEQLVDLGDLDDTEEDLPEYGVAKMNFFKIRPFPIFKDRPNACGTGAVAPTWSKVFEKSDTFGNSKFGAGTGASIPLASESSPLANKDKLSGEAVGRAYGTLFGLSKDVARVTLKASLQGSTGSSSINVKVVGVDVFNKSKAGDLADSKSFDKTFFSASQRIWLGPVPLKVTATANGKVGFEYKTVYQGSKVNFTAKPYARAYATATGAVDVVIASGGVTGTLTLVEVSAPASVVLTIQPTYVSYDVDADLNIKALAGRLDAWAKVWTWRGPKKWTTNLAKWNGVNSTIPIVHTEGCHSI